MPPRTTPLHVELVPGRTWTLDELPPRSIALDGAVRGPAIDTASARYSFDHHDGVIRHATLATCEQVRDALLVGLDPRGYHVFVNDVDGDTALSSPVKAALESGAQLSDLPDLLARLPREVLAGCLRPG